MPELPEVETVRRGVDAAFRGGRISAVEVYNPRTVRRHAPGIADFQANLAGLEVTGSGRRGKFMWLGLDDGRALVCHLGMSGQLHVVTDGREAHKHLRGRMRFADERELWFIDQRGPSGSGSWRRWTGRRRRRWGTSPRTCSRPSSTRPRAPRGCAGGASR
nr:DNA-formamidopyrimidine glycosylase family protein [Glycomyces sp. NRRL B-16210]